MRLVTEFIFTIYLFIYSTTTRMEKRPHYRVRVVNTGDIIHKHIELENLVATNTFFDNLHIFHIIL